ncbi:hypothetical protein I4U23_026170 [Adineta vaga]|nr:hypothetical protein I4U23_026170 [Adineta vaga]
MSKRAHIRRRQDSDDEDDSRPNDDDSNEATTNKESDNVTNIEDLKLIQKLRQRKNGLSAEELALGKQSNPLFSLKKNDSNDPYKMKSGGLVEMNSFKQQQRTKDLSTINDNFARETNTRDEDTEMQRYIEEQLVKRQHKSSDPSSTFNSAANNELTAVFATLKKPEDTLFHVSKHLITDHSTQASEEMLSEQMLSGIPEVDIGVEEKIRNIEETDKAKRKLIQTMRDKKGTEKKLTTAIAQSAKPISLLVSEPVVPSTPSKSASISFVQHKRFNTDGMDIMNSKKFKQNQIKETIKPQPVVGNKEKHPTLLRDPKPTSGPEKPLAETATDDFVFDRFRKNLHGLRNCKIRHA